MRMPKVAVASARRGPSNVHPDPLVRDDTAEVGYMLVCAEGLPAINATRTVGVYLLGEKGAKRHVSFMRRYASICIFVYFIGIIYRMYAMIVPARLSGYWWLMFSFLMQLPSVSSVSFALRYELVWQLAKSFEFWFFLAVNVTWVVSLFIGYQDSRVVVCFMSLLELENAKMADANAQRLQYIAPAALLSCFTLGLCSIGILVDAIEIHNPVVWMAPRGHILKLSDLLVTAMTTISLLMARLAYRKRHAWRHTDNDYIQCVSCRCRLKFALDLTPENLLVHQSTGFVNKPLLILPSSTTTTDPPWRPVVPSKMSTFQLECTPIPTRFAATRVVGRRKIVQVLQTRWIRWSWALFSAGALLTAVALAAMAPPGLKPATSTQQLAALALSLTICAASPFIALHQSQLLGRLFTSFDFLFLLLQNLLAGISVCHLAQWRFEQGVVVACVTVWFYVMITYDALTPVAKQTLGWTPIRATALAAFLLGAHVLLGVQLLFEGGWDLEDRVLAEFSLFGRRVRVFVIPFLISRLFIIVIWNCRLLWRLVACSRRPGGEMELITLLGSVQYRRLRSSTVR